MMTGPTIQYMYTHEDGSFTVRVAASGKTYSDALSNAKRYALKQVIFNGVANTESSILAKPLVTEVNAEEKYQNFFNAFFADNGAYKKFATSQDKKKGSDKKNDDKISVRITSTVRVLRADLKDYLINNNILKP